MIIANMYGVTVRRALQFLIVELLKRIFIDSVACVVNFEITLNFLHFKL